MLPMSIDFTIGENLFTSSFSPIATRMTKDSYILSFKPTGVSTSPDIHDTSAAISRNGKIIAAIEEERLCRIKHAVGVFPIRSISYCLKEAGVNFSDLDSIVIPNDPDLYIRNAFNFRNWNRIMYRYKISKKFKEESSLVSSFLYYLPNKEKIRMRILTYLKNSFGDQNYPEIVFLGHHLCHAASCFYPSGFDNASIITIDGIGDMDSTVIWSWDDKNINREVSWGIENSLGYFYGAFTVFLGYKFCNGEAKVMGLAPYGEKNKEIFDVFENIVSTNVDGYDVTEISIPMTNGFLVGIKRIEELFGIKRILPGEPITKEHKDLAFACQHFLEKIGENLARQAINVAGSKKICMTGGVTLNCKMNKKIIELPEVEDIFIQPVANDAGLVLGGVLEASNRCGFDCRFNMKHNYFGPSFDNATIKSILGERKIVYLKIKSLKPIAQAITDGKFVGWFHGHMEMGPRALGNRSILCDPRRNDLKDKLNDLVKHREKWRPYAPSILEDYVDEYIENFKVSAPFMIKTFDVKKKYRDNIEAVLHPTDKTTRPHVVSREVNPRFYELIDEFRKITDIPLVLNTSYNDHGEPIVCTPQDAIRVFYGTGLDILILEDYMITKE